MSEIRSLDASGKIDTSAMRASSVAATQGVARCLGPRGRARNAADTASAERSASTRSLVCSCLTLCNPTVQPNSQVVFVPVGRNFSVLQPFMLPRRAWRHSASQVRVVKDKSKMNEMSVPRRSADDSLGANSDIGAKLRAFYGAVQDQPILTSSWICLRNWIRSNRPASGRAAKPWKTPSFKREAPSRRSLRFEPLPSR